MVFAPLEISVMPEGSVHTYDVGEFVTPLTDNVNSSSIHNCVDGDAAIDPPEGVDITETCTEPFITCLQFAAVEADIVYVPTAVTDGKLKAPLPGEEVWPVETPPSNNV